MPPLVVRPEIESSFEWDTFPIMIHSADFNNRPHPRNPKQQSKREDGYQKLSHTSSNKTSIKIVDANLPKDQSKNDVNYSTLLGDNQVWIIRC